MNLSTVIVSGVDVTDKGTRQDKSCPRCGGDVYRYPWWDDEPDNGGAIIGSIDLCNLCDFEEYL